MSISEDEKGNLTKKEVFEKSIKKFVSAGNLGKPSWVKLIRIEKFKSNLVKVEVEVVKESSHSQPDGNLRKLLEYLIKEHPDFLISDKHPYYHADPHIPQEGKWIQPFMKHKKEK